MLSREREYQFRPKEVTPGKTPVSFFDIDGTLVQGLTLISFSRYLASRDLLAFEDLEKMEQTLKDYQQERINNEHDAYTRLAAKIVDQYAAAMREKPVSLMQQEGSIFLERVLGGEVLDGYNLFGYAQELVKLMKRVGKTIAISGSPIEALVPLSEHLGLDDLKATILEQDNGGYYTGRVGVNLALDQNKQAIVSAYLQGNIDITHSFAFGDSTHDRPLLDVVSNPVVLGNNPDLINHGKENRWIVPEDSTNVIRLVKERIDTIFESI